jgi:hypothetical protein
MRFGLVDLLIAILLASIGALAARFLLPIHLLPVTAPCCAIGVYLAAVAPIYRRLELLPMILPRCPCCMKLQNSFTFIPDKERVICRCPTCDGEFVIWFSGQVGPSETWDRPVLALKWPYAWGRYKRIGKPDPLSSA